LKIHSDFSKHPKFNLDRRVNVLIYLNKDWSEEFAGHFELWDAKMKHCVKKVLPKFNTIAVFSTDDFSYHGHPDPLLCPDNRSRKSLALYYYRNGRPSKELEQNSDGALTKFKQRPNNFKDYDAFKQDYLIRIKSIIKEITPPIIIKALISNSKR
jgi:hypothetical protein